MQAQDRKIVVALSGGVDSAVAAARLLEEGWQVRGVHLLLTEKQEDLSSLKALCTFLGIACLPVDLRQEFRAHIISYFSALYRAGKTPNPCVRCNELIKFGELFRIIRSWGYRYLATGHYARIGSDAAGRAALLRGRDTRKDQSYFLHRLSPEVLSSIMLPLGELTKDQVKEMSSSLGLDRFLPVRESQELCFISGSYADVLKQAGAAGLDCPGPMVNRRGETLGQHRGLEHYTVGQRQGLGVPAAAPYYVLEIIPELNQLVIGFKEELQAAALEVEDINWLIPPPTETFAAQVRLRFRHPGVGCTIFPTSAGIARVVLHIAQTAITPGQAAVFYRGEQVLGGGWIVRALNA